MNKYLIIPEKNKIESSIELSKIYNLGYEFNDFYFPDVLDDDNIISELIDFYDNNLLNSYKTIHGAFIDVTIFSPDSKIREISRERIYQSVNIAKALKTKAVIFHTNHIPFITTKKYKTTWLDYNIDFFRTLLIDNPNLNIYIENMFDSTPEYLLDLSKELCDLDNYGVCLDYAHANISPMDPSIWVNTLSSYIKHIHLNDNDGKNDLHLPIGKGLINWSNFKTQLSQLNNPTILIETSTIESQISSIDYLSSLNLL